VQGEHFLKPDGTRLRLWGVNIASTSCFPPKDQAPRIAEDLARLADLDGDGDLDLLNKPYTWDTPRVHVWLNNGTGPVTQAVPIAR